MKRDRWTEGDVLALPTGQEHDYFDRKSGQLFEDLNHFREELAVQASAFANSGGGHLVLGLLDDGVTFDGVPRMRGRTPTREWIEQILPQLLDYPLQDFRVHTVLRADQSTIPSERDVVVIDFGDSAAAPNQTADSRIYYHRVGGHSRRASHFYLETLRSRLTSPLLEVSLHEVRLRSAFRVRGRPFLDLALVARVRNNGRVAAYHWAVSMEYNLETRMRGREELYYFDRAKFPTRQGRAGGLALDRTLLPTLSADQDFDFGLYLWTQAAVGGGIEPYSAEIHALMSNFSVTLRAISETSVGPSTEWRLADVTDFVALTGAASSAGDIGIT